jgi:polyphosphate kinase
VLRKGDLLLHHPYESFAPVVELLRQAAADPDVLAIKQTLYRTGEDSPVVGALLDAARAGKEVTAVIELRARFDEEQNIDLATRLQEAGAAVVYGVVGYKTHAKMTMIVRREGRRLRRYVHLGTGNYHTRTARVYTDFGLLTCDADIGEDVHKVFLQLTGMGKATRLAKLLHAPFTLRDQLLEWIDAEAAAAREGRPARIAAKLNALTEPTMIQALYRASQAGVPIDLVVRGVCRLRPGVPGVSETIRVRSIVGRFLEHSRVYLFHRGGREVVLCASADWMERNLFHRVETCFPVEDEKLAHRVKTEGLEEPLRDDAQAWVLQSDGRYERATPGPEPFAVQRALLERLAD